MLKNILNLNGAQQLSKNEQQVVNGGICVNQRYVYNITPANCLLLEGVPKPGNKCLVGSC